MTPRQMQLSFLQRLGESTQRDLDISTLDIEKFLNISMEKFVNIWYRGFEVNEESRKRLSALVTTIELTTADIKDEEDTSRKNLPNGFFFRLPTNCKYVLKESLQLYEELELEEGQEEPEQYIFSPINVKPINLDYYNKHVNNSFKKPYKNLAWRLDLGNNLHEIITDGTHISSYVVHYLKNPVKISILASTPVQCELREDYHEEIVEGAVIEALTTLQLKSSPKNNEN